MDQYNNRQKALERLMEMYDEYYTSAVPTGTLQQRHNVCYIVGLGPNCKFIDLLFKRLVITFIKVNFLNCFIVLEIIFSQTDTLTEELMYLR